MLESSVDNSTSAFSALSISAFNASSKDNSADVALTTSLLKSVVAAPDKSLIALVKSLSAPWNASTISVNESKAVGSILERTDSILLSKLFKESLKSLVKTSILALIVQFFQASKFTKLEGWNSL